MLSNSTLVARVAHKEFPHCLRIPFSNVIHMIGAKPSHLKNPTQDRHTLERLGFTYTSQWNFRWVKFFQYLFFNPIPDDLYQDVKKTQTFEYNVI